MGGVGSLLGVNGGMMGTGIGGPQSATIASTTDPAQIKKAYDDTQASMAKQQELLTAIQAQNGLQNQSNVYNQLQGVANGTGPNPAQAMLNQATNANVDNQAALMAGQRGASSNVGLMARQAAQQGANTQQQAVGQAATMQANQSLNAINSSGTMANSMANNQINQTNANTAAQQANQSNLINAQTSYNNASVANQSNLNNVNGQLANTQMQGQQATYGGIMGGISSMAKMAAQGGEVKSSPSQAPAPQVIVLQPATKLAEGGPVSMFGQSGVQAASGPNVTSTPDFGGAGAGAQALHDGISSSMSKKDDGSIKPGKGQKTAGGPMDAGSQSSNSMKAAKGGMVPTLLSPGEKYLSPKDVKQVAEGKKEPLKAGKTIPGQAKVKGAKNSYSNDTVPANLEEGGIVIPRSVTQGKHPGFAAKKFVDAILAKKALEGKK